MGLQELWPSPVLALAGLQSVSGALLEIGIQSPEMGKRGAACIIVLHSLECFYTPGQPWAGEWVLNGIAHSAHPLKHLVLAYHHPTGCSSEPKNRGTLTLPICSIEAWRSS